MTNENEFLLHALLMGIFITFVYDLLRIFRRVLRHNGFFVALEDLGFWVYCGAEVFLLMYHESNGSLRWFAVLGALVGMFLYKKLISSLFVKYTSLVLCKILEFLGRILGVVWKPVRILCRRTGGEACKAGRGLKRIAGRVMRRIKNRLTYFVKMFKMSLRK